MESGAGPSHTSSNPVSSPSGPLEKPRSCAICAKRKVRCDKQYPCSRCRRAGIQCVLPAVDNRPRYARPLISLSESDAKALPPGVAIDKILDRVKVLERLVKDLSDELEHARAASAASDLQDTPHSSEASSVRTADASATNPQIGRIVRDDSDRVRYVSSGFWSRVDHELDTLKQDTHSNGRDAIDRVFEGEPSRSKPSKSAAEADRMPLDRHDILLKYSLSSTSHDASTYLPMASQVPFLLEVYSERVHFIIGLPHLPSLKKRLQQRRGGRMENLSPCEEVLVFSVFYAAICSLDEDEVADSFNLSKDELVLRYRTGLEQSLAKADFLNNPSVDLVQAFVIFLALARRHDSPRYVWMMTGLVVRMARYLGMHQDGLDSKHITPFQAEMQRRIWWDLCVLDMRASEDQATELAIPHGSYTTRLPSNVNDDNIWPEMDEPPLERDGLTNVTLLRLCSKIELHIQEMMTLGDRATIYDHDRQLADLVQAFERDYFSLTDKSQDTAYLAAAGWMRLALGRLTLLAFFPVLFSSPSAEFSAELRTKLLVAAIDVAEHNHALNSDTTCQPWRWVYQTQQNWHAVVYLLLEICRRPWSSTMERAWMALQSPWLVPSRAATDKNFSVWVPLKKLMARARKHRDSEIVGLKNDTQASARLEKHDQQQIPVPSSSNTFPSYFDPEIFYKRWRQLIRPETNTLNGTTSIISTDHNITHNGVSFGSPADTSNMYEISPPQYDNLRPVGATLHGVNTSSASAPWLEAHTDLSEGVSLDAFLGLDTEMDLSDVMNDADDDDFDWNSWFESAKEFL